MECSVFVKFIWSNVSFKADVSLLIISLDDLSIDEGGMLKPPTVMILLSISPFKYVNICVIYLVALILDTMYLRLLYLLNKLTLNHYINAFFSLVTIFGLKFILSKHSYLWSLFVSICMESLFPFKKEKHLERPYIGQGIWFGEVQR